ncbi:hypothetical protein B9Z55_008814 [Caenorhabditis nigoni]|uniref:Little elongation complex subunit 2 C-terminal domain-containing protein n=1 Tax=Caenorhabditis nigoni TaxID=1611254 RepID=A0A2G5UPC9_9PELO|nr:hypothetical protein B9Z55_008814 [Caenorhabditis nigoni]
MSLEEADIRCQIAWQLDQDKKYDEVVAHVLTGCLNCVTNPKKRFGGREMLFPDGPPPWIKVPESEKSNPEAWKWFHKKKVRSEMSLEEFEQYLVDSDLSDGQLAMEIAKFRRIEKVASWKYVGDIRRKQKEKRLEQEKREKEAKKLDLEAKKEAEKLKKQDEKRKNLEEKQLKDDEKLEYLKKMKEDEKLLEEVLEEEIKDEQSAENEEKSKKSEKKEFNLRKDMPWSPSTYDFLCADKRSIIDQSQQKRMIAMCQSLMYEGQLRYSGNRDELKDIRRACEPEYDTLVAAALEHARNEACHPLDFSTEKSIRFCLNRFKTREIYTENDTFSFKNPSFTVENVEILSGIRSEHQGIVPKMEKMLKSATWQSELILPDISKKCEVKHWDLRPPAPKTRLLDDSIAHDLISTCKQTTVLSDATTICHLLSPNWESRDYEFGIPIQVKIQRIDGVDKKCVIMSKPVPSTSISKATIQRKTLKRALKNQFLKRIPLKKSQKRATLDESSSEEASSQESTSSAAPTTSSESLLDSMLREMKETDQKFASSKGNSEEIPENSEDLSYQYAIFRIGDARILIRSSGAHLLNEQGDKKRQILENCRKVTFEPRIEYLSNGGAMEIGAAEWVWNYTKAVFKTSQSHVVYRTNYRLDHVLQIDPLSMRIDKQQPPPDALGILSARCVMLERMIAQLEQLEPGDYCAVQERDRPLIVVPKCSTDQRGGVSLGASLTRDDCKKTTDSWKDDDYFHGFCRDVALQWQIVQGRAPQLLLAKDSAINAQMPSKMNRDQFQRKKTSMKRKFAQKEAEKEDAKRHKALDLDDPNLYADFTNPSILPQDFVKPKPKNFHFRGGGRGGRGRARGRGRGAFRGGGAGGGGSGPSTSDGGGGSDAFPAIP